MKMTESEIKKMEKEIKESYKNVKPIREAPAMIEATIKLTDLKQKLKEINEKFFEAGEKADASVDGQNLLEGKPLGDRASREALNREKAAVTSAIEIQSQNIRELESRLIRAGCEEFKIVAEEFAKNTFAAFEDVKAALTKQRMWYDYISRMGYQLDLRPAHWREIAYEQQFLTTVDYYLEQRRLFWKF